MNLSQVGLNLALKATADCVGFATKILQRYFDVFIPRALALSQQARQPSLSAVGVDYRAEPPFAFYPKGEMRLGFLI